MVHQHDSPSISLKLEIAVSDLHPLSRTALRTRSGRVRIRMLTVCSVIIFPMTLLMRGREELHKKQCLIKGSGICTPKDESQPTTDQNTGAFLDSAMVNRST